jgi:hypothetical protein
VFLVQGRGEMAVLIVVTALQLRHSAFDIWTACCFLVQGRDYVVILPIVTAVLLHQFAMDTWTDSSVVSTG